MQDVGEISDDQHQNAHNEAEQNDVLGHCGAFVVLAHSVEELDEV